jgi:hypothetical protein
MGHPFRLPVRSPPNPLHPFHGALSDLGPYSAIALRGAKLIIVKFCKTRLADSEHSQGPPLQKPLPVKG